MIIGAVLTGSALVVHAAPTSTSERPDMDVRRGIEQITDPPTHTILVSPTLINIPDAAPGSVHVAKIKIRNRRATTSTFSVLVEGIAGSTNPLQRIVFLKPGDPAMSRTAAAWVQPATASITLKPHEYAEVPVMLTVPHGDGARPGGHYAAVIVRDRHTTSLDDQRGGRVGVQPEVAVPILITVPGKARRSLRVHSVTAPQRVTSRARWSAHIVIENSGDVHLDPVGTVSLISPFGGVVEQLPISTRTLLPGGRAAADVHLRRAPLIGWYRVRTSIHAARDSNGSGVAARADRTLYVTPPWWILIIVAVALVAVSMMWLRRRNDDDGIDDDALDE